MLSWFVPTAFAQAAVSKGGVDVCRSFFNWLQVIPCAGSGSTDENSSIVGVILNVVNFLLAVSASVAMGVIVYAGIQILFSAAVPERIAEAKKLITWAIIGLVVVMSAFLLTTIVKNMVYALPLG